jgi:hypothetical protein
MLNSSSPGSSKNSSAQSDAPATTSTTARVLAETATRPTVPVTVTTAPVVAAAPTTTTTRPSTTTTTRAAQAAARPTTTTTRKPAPAKKPAADCGTGDTTFSVGSVSDQAGGYVATVKNSNTKAIDIDKFTVKLTYSDGTVHTIDVPGAAGTKVDSGTTRTFNFSDSSGDASVSSQPEITSAYHTDGQTNCAAS